MNPRFEVDYKTRLEQQREARDLVLLPRLGFKKYKIYDEKPAVDKVALNQLYSQMANIILPKHLQKTSYNFFADELADSRPETYTVKWLKPKQVTLLRLQGKKVEEHR